MSTARVLFVCCLLPTLACTPAPEQDGSTSMGSETGASAGTTETGETGETPEDGHGMIRIEVSPLGGDLSILEGTAKVVATLNYETCLQDFYLATNPGLQQNGPEGASVFAAWQEVLCDPMSSPLCTVDAIAQTLVEVSDVYSLSVTYAITDDATLAYRELFVGPLPDQELAACGAGLQPTVELRQAGLAGYDANDEQIWRISTLPASNQAVAGQGAPLRVEVIDLP